MRCNVESLCSGKAAEGEEDEGVDVKSLTLSSIVCRSGYVLRCLGAHRPGLAAMYVGRSSSKVS